jgi:serine/threonine protein kinase, bacterial
MTIFCPSGHDNPDTNRFCQSCGCQLVTPVNTAMTVGIILGNRYRITKEIGQGGFGRTYLCEDINRFNELCVLKEFAPQVQGTAFLTKAQELFEREGGVMYRLQHPQIPMFREMFRENRGGIGQLFLVQDYVAGNNYQQLLRKKRKQGTTFSEAEMTAFLTQILPVLGYIHALGVIHRDISPDNLIRRESDRLPVLIDFGGVKQVAVAVANQYMSGAHNVENNNSYVPTRLGKVGYAPNEQIQRGVVSPHSDLYALAATTLVLLTGKEPPDLIDPQSFTWNWREHVSLSPKLAAILDRMLQLRPNDRFASAQDVLTALQTPEAPISSPPPLPPPPPPLQQPIGSNPKMPATVVTNPKERQAGQQIPATVATATKEQQSARANSGAKDSSLIAILGKTWMFIAAVVGAIALGWLVASLTSKYRPGQFNSPNRSTVLPQVPSQSHQSSLLAASPNPVAPSRC